MTDHTCGYDGCCELAVYIPELCVPLVGVPRSVYVLKAQLGLYTCAKHFADLKVEDIMLDTNRELWEIINRMSAAQSGAAPAPIAWHQRYLTPIRLDSEAYRSYAKTLAKA